MRRWLRRLRGAIGNAVVWGMGWFGAGVGVAAVLYGMGVMSGVPFWVAALALGKSFASLGFVMGGGFALYLGIAAGKQTLEELNPWQLSAGAAGLAAAGIGGLTLLAGGAPLAALVTVVGVVGGLAGATSFTVLKIAQGGLSDGQPRSRVDAGGGDLLLGPP